MNDAQWYPGTMARAVDGLKKDLPLVDLVVELIDARAPVSSRNPELKDIIGKKNRLILLHKADRGERAINSRWLLHFKEQALPAMLTSVQIPGTVSSFLEYLKTQGRRLRSSRFKRPLRLVIVGIPNVGKSTLLNYLVGRAAARTGDRPGVTRGRQWVRLLAGVELLDTPGILPPLLSPEAVFPLAAIGALPPERIDRQQSALSLLRYYAERGMTSRLTAHYGEGVEGAPVEMLEQIGKERGCLLPGGKIDLERAAALLLAEYQAGRLGKLSLELPPKIEGEGS
ncbi:MAG TPA: ribosome biogenesis GTPase YlqF [Firmicutes bacterium]|nr:ribosome biogenesis GTPase YlqF [Bacillota bacterium]